MKYKVTKGTPIYDLFMELKTKVDHVCKMQKDFLAELNSDFYYKKRGVAWGGIEGISFKDEVPAGWKILDKSNSMYYPKNNNKEMLEKINSLPVVSFEDINIILKFKRQKVEVGRKFTVFNCPGIYFRNECVLIDVDSRCKYNPPVDVIEILESEFIKLNKEETKS